MIHKEETVTGRSLIQIKQVNTMEENIARYLLVTDKYKRKGYLEGVKRIPIQKSLQHWLSTENYTSIPNEASFNGSYGEGGIFNDSFNEIYIDKYHWNSKHFIALDNTNIVGSARLIEKNSIGLPTLGNQDIKIFDEYAFLCHQNCAEFSQFVVREGECAHISIGLIKIAYLYSIKVMNIEKWVATIDNSVLRFFNSRFFNFNLPAIGPSVKYLGSLCTPVYIDLKSTLENSARFDSSRSIAEFILDTSNDGFEDVEIII